MITCFIVDVINMHFLSPMIDNFLLIIVDKYQASTWGPHIFATIKKFDFLHLMQRTYLKTYFEHYYDSFLQNPLPLIPSTVKEESFDILIMTTGKSGTSYIQVQRCGPMCPMGYKIPQGNLVSRRGTRHCPPF